MGKRFVRVVATALTVLGPLFLPALGGVAQAVTQADIVSLDATSQIVGDVSTPSVTISADGRFVFFSTDAANVVPGVVPPVGTYEIYRRDRQAGVTELISHDSSGVVAGYSSVIGISDDGQTIAYGTQLPNIVGAVDVIYNVSTGGYVYPCGMVAASSDFMPIRNTSSRPSMV